MSRRPVPNRRHSINFEFALNPYASASTRVVFTGALGFCGLQPVEVFLSCSRSNDIEALGRDAAILISLLLQHGCSFETMRNGVTRGALDPQNLEARPPASSLVGRLLDEIELVTLDQARMLLGDDGA